MTADTSITRVNLRPNIKHLQYTNMTALRILSGRLSWALARGFHRIEASWPMDQETSRSIDLVTRASPTFQGGGILDWTPDGQNIVYADGIGEIFITDLQGNRREITSDHKPFFRPSGPVSVSPNNAQVLYEQTSTDFFRHIWVINIDGSSARQFAR